MVLHGITVCVLLVVAGARAPKHPSRRPRERWPRRSVGSLLTARALSDYSQIMSGLAEAQVAQVRRFNRVVTERVGALSDRYMGRDRPLGEARVLWEIGPDGCGLARLRARLALDSGYLSRLLASLQSDGLVEVAEDPRDRRARVARLTPRGEREREDARCPLG